MYASINKCVYFAILTLKQYFCYLTIEKKKMLSPTLGFADPRLLAKELALFPRQYAM